MALILGIIFGVALAGSLAFLISACMIAKSNDFGDSTAPLERYTGYDPIMIENMGQVSGGGLAGGLGGGFSGFNFKL